MGKTLDLGRRIELVSMDKYLGKISIGLYRSKGDDGMRFRVHSYSQNSGTARRIEFIAKAMTVMGGLQPIADSPDQLRFSCGSEHQKAVKRLFLEACKLDPTVEPTPRGLTVRDKKTGSEIVITSVGKGAYESSAQPDEPVASKRASVAGRGLSRLLEMELDSENPKHVKFECGTVHDELVGVGMLRALDVRSAIREEEMSSTRGVLSAPSTN